MPHIISFKNSCFTLNFTGFVRFRMNGPDTSIEAGKEAYGIKTGYTVLNDESSASISLSVTNCTDLPIEILQIESIHIDTPEGISAGLPWTDIQAMILGRHKNDIPSIVTLGQMDDAMSDALSGMTETGQKAAGSDSETVLGSDTLTVLKGASGYLSFEYPGGETCFCFTRISPDGHSPALTSGCEPGIIIAPGSTLTAETLELHTASHWENLLSDYTRRKSSRLGTRHGTVHVPSVFCTWYYYGLTVSYADIQHDLSEIIRRKLPYEVFQIDEGWEITLGEWQPNHRFPVSMKALASEIRAAGLIPGIWTSPFIAHKTASIWKSHPEWRLLNTSSEPVLFPMNDTVYHVLDITIPAVRDYIRNFYSKLTQEWGYSYHKLDFTRAAVLYPEAKRHDPAMPLPKAYRLAMQAVREGIGDDSFLLVCGGLYDAAIGIADAQRTGSDVLSMWASEGDGGKAVPFTVKQNLLRSYMSAWWYNDADCLMLRRQKTMTRDLKLTLGLLSDVEIRTVLVNQYVSCGLLSQTEPLQQIESDRLKELGHLLPLIPAAATPELFDGERIPSRIHLHGDGFLELILINWQDNTDLPVTLSAEDVLGSCATEGRYLLSAFYSRSYCIVSGNENCSLGTIPPHGAEIIRIQPYTPELPMIVSSTGHFALGAELDQIKNTSDGVILHPVQPLPFDVRYTVLKPDGTCTDVQVTGTSQPDC